MNLRSALGGLLDKNALTTARDALDEAIVFMRTHLLSTVAIVAIAAALVTLTIAFNNFLDALVIPRPDPFAPLLPLPPGTTTEDIYQMALREWIGNLPFLIPRIIGLALISNMLWLAVILLVVAILHPLIEAWAMDTDDDGTGEEDPTDDELDPAPNEFPSSAISRYISLVAVFPFLALASVAVYLWGLIPIVGWFTNSAMITILVSFITPITAVLILQGRTIGRPALAYAMAFLRRNFWPIAWLLIQVAVLRIMLETVFMSLRHPRIILPIAQFLEIIHPARQGVFDYHFPSVEFALIHAPTIILVFVTLIAVMLFFLDAPQPDPTADDFWETSATPPEHPSQPPTYHTIPLNLPLRPALPTRADLFNYARLSIFLGILWIAQTIFVGAARALIHTFLD